MGVGRALYFTVARLALLAILSLAAAWRVHGASCKWAEEAARNVCRALGPAHKACVHLTAARSELQANCHLPLTESASVSNSRPSCIRATAHRSRWTAWGVCPPFLEHEKATAADSLLQTSEGDNAAFDATSGDSGSSSRCKATMNGAPAGTNPCYIGCHCDASTTTATRCDMCNWVSTAGKLDGFTQPWAVANNVSGQVAAFKVQAEAAVSTDTVDTMTSFAVENNGTTLLCPDGAVTPAGFWMSKGRVGQGSAGWCQMWESSAAESSEVDFCNMTSSTHKVCSKMAIMHPHLTPASVGMLVAKRLSCTGNVCAVTKVGLCIDVQEPVFVLESCAPSHTKYAQDSSTDACQVCNAAKSNCHVSNTVLSDNTGAQAWDIPAMSITQRKLDAKSMRVKFAELAIAKLNTLTNGVIPANWTYSCQGAVAERVNVIMKLA